MLGINHAIRGLILMFKTERNFKIQFLIFLVVLILGFIFKISKTEWLVVLLISATVLSLEIINSAIEKLGNTITTLPDERIKNIKDISAAAVLLSSIIASIIGILIFYPYFYSLLST